MIVIDTSALMAILLREPEALECSRVLGRSGPLLISAATVAEALIVSERRGVGMEMSQLIEGLELEVDSVSPASARGVAQAYAKWGKGQHPAGLNFGDCFSYELAKRHEFPLLCVGRDFVRTDLSTLPQESA
ncbi:MAG: type II toxin-antitoxin system VapC family toxin [Gammaproteobacteria bacterium]|nr:type II toxin-antitoxin system VapC family toxin [Gammaproteobacteria bacterium]